MPRAASVHCAVARFDRRRDEPLQKCNLLTLPQVASEIALQLDANRKECELFDTTSVRMIAQPADK
jgi:hypothetical protein